MFVPKGQIDSMSLLVQPSDDSTQFTDADKVNFFQWRLVHHPASLSEIYHSFCHLHEALNLYTDRYSPHAQ